LRPGLAAGLAGVFAASLTLGGGPVPGYARDPDRTVDAARSAQPAVSRIVAGSFYSPAMQSPRQFEIYLPPSYEQDPQRTYPVLYLLHGDGGHVGDWAAFGLRSKMDNAIAGARRR
jgi:S-formylglutathione hydrolase FrmB